MARTGLTGDQVVDDTLTGADIDESTLVDSLVPFSDVGFTSTNIHDAIIEAKSGGIDPHPIDLVAFGDTLTINVNRHHIVLTEMVNLGVVINNGTLGVL